MKSSEAMKYDGTPSGQPMWRVMKNWVENWSDKKTSRQPTVRLSFGRNLDQNHKLLIFTCSGRSKQHREFDGKREERSREEKRSNERKGNLIRIYHHIPFEFILIWAVFNCFSNSLPLKKTLKQNTAQTSGNYVNITATLENEWGKRQAHWKAESLLKGFGSVVCWPDCQTCFLSSLRFDGFFFSPHHLRAGCVCFTFDLCFCFQPGYWVSAWARVVYWAPRERRMRSRNDRRM